MLSDFDVYVCRICKGYPLEFTPIEGAKSSWWAKCPHCGFVSQAPYSTEEKEDHAKFMGFRRPGDTLRLQKPQDWQLLAAIRRKHPGSLLTLGPDETDYMYHKHDSHFDICFSYGLIERLWDGVSFLRHVQQKILHGDGVLAVLSPLVEDHQMSDHSVFSRAHVSLYSMDSIQRAGSQAGFAFFQSEPSFMGHLSLMTFRKGAPHDS
jgi:hypothetical protein